MAEKMINTRIINKHDTADNWAKAVNFIPKKGELIVYDGDDAFYEKNYADLINIPEGSVLQTIHAQLPVYNNGLSFRDRNNNELLNFNLGLDNSGTYYFHMEQHCIEDELTNIVELDFPWDEYEKIKTQIVKVYGYEGIITYQTSLTSKIKIGDGVTKINNLPFVSEKEYLELLKKDENNLNEAKIYTDKKATLGINFSKVYYTDEDNEIYVFGDQYLEIPEEFEGNITEIIVSKEPGDTAPYIQVSFYDVEYNLIETIEILPESPNEYGDGEFINISREVNITGAAYVMGSDCGCSMVGTLTLINKSQTNLGEEVNKKDIKVLESAKIYADNLSDEMLEISKTYTNELQVDIKSADVDKSVYTYTFNGEKINLDLVSDFSFWSDKDANETFFHLIFDENKFILDHKYHYGYARFCNPNNLNDFIYGIIHLTDASQEFDPNLWEIVYYGYVEMTEEEFISRYPYFLISKSSEIDKYEWKPIDDILPDNNVIYKRAITKSWENQNDYIPAENEMIIYDKDELIERNYIADFIEVDNPIEIVEIINYGSQVSNVPSNTTIKFKTSSSSVEFSYSLDLLAEWYGGIGTIVSKIDFANKELYLSDTLGNIDIEDINWVKASDVFESQGYADNIPVFSWDEYEAIKHEITLIEFPSGSIKYYNYPYSLKTKIKIGDGETTVNDLPFIEQTFDDFILEDGTNLSSVLKLNSCFMDYGYHNTTETGYEGQGRDDITTVTLGYDNINKSIYSLVTGKNNINTGNDSLITACFNENYGKQALICGFQNKNELADEENVNSSNNVFMAGAYNKNVGISNSVFGHHNITSGYGQTVMGKFSKDNSNILFAVGNGISETKRKNAFEIDAFGNVFIANRIKDINGNDIIPISANYESAILTTAAKDILNESPSATGIVTTQDGKLNRIVLPGDISKYIDKNIIKFTDSRSGMEYIEKIYNIESRTDGRTNIEFLTNNVDFGVDGANGWANRIGNSLYIFRNSSEWSDAPILKDLTVTNLYIDNQKSMALPQDNVTDSDERVYIHKTNYLTLYQSSFTTGLLCGTVSGKYNRLVLPKEFFLVNEPDSLIGKTVQFYTSATDYVEETVVNIELRADGEKYNFEYTTNNVPFGIVKADLLNAYSDIKVIEEVYEWNNLPNIGDIHEKVETTVFFDYEDYIGDLIVPEEHQNMISFTVEGYGHESATVDIYFIDGTMRHDFASAENGESHTYTYTVDKPVEKISIGNPTSAFYIVEYTYYKKGSSISIQDYIDQSEKISLEKSKQYTDNAIQQAIFDSWEVGV